MSDSQRYRAFLLRGWLEEVDPDKNDRWRFRLRDVQSGRQWAFDDLESAYAFIEKSLSREVDDK